MTPKEDASRRHLAGVIAHREVAERQNRGVHPRVEALGKARLAPVGSAKRMSEARYPADVMAAGAGTERNRLGSILVPNSEHTLCNFVERVVPGNALPLSRLAFTFASHRIFQPVRVVNK